MTFSNRTPRGIESDHHCGEAQSARNQEEGRRRYARTAVGRGAAGVLTRSTHPSYTRCRRANACGARRSTIAPTGPQARIMKGVVKVVTAETATAIEVEERAGGGGVRFRRRR